MIGTEEKPRAKGFDEGYDFPEESRTNPDGEVMLLRLLDNAPNLKEPSVPTHGTWLLLGGYTVSEAPSILSRKILL